jgi:alkanesulfonate monooxygenase SsuD/methylene tetrahydromethanopterin reductase-like flavin-dependent oxidoreductase (luciferase family)
MGGQAGPKALALAARFADEYNIGFRTPEQCAEVRERLDAACRAEGRDPIPLSLMTQVIVGRDEAEADRRADALHELTAAFIPGDVRQPPRIYGTVPQVVARLREYEQAGISGLYAQHLVHEDLDFVRLVGAEVVPAVA